jgi:signal transduction histidine kinase
MCPLLYPPFHNNVFVTDKQWLIENIFCFLSNARKCTTEGEITIRCSLQLPTDLVRRDEAMSEADNRVVTVMLLIEVEDTGRGITEENRKFLFSQTYQVESIL